MNIFNRNKTTGQTELVTNSAIGEGTQLSEATQQYLSQQESDAQRDEDPAGWAAEQLQEFNLTPGAQLLMDRAVDNLSRNTGVGLVDEDAKFDAQQRAAIINASGNDLNVAITALSASCEVEEAGGVVYSLLFNVLKSAVFIGNIDYRNFLDPSRDMDLHLYVNYGEVGKSTGEDARDPSDPKFHTDNRLDRSPLEGQSGFETHAEFQLARMKELYGPLDIDEEGDVVAASLRDLRLYFQLLSESFG